MDILTTPDWDCVAGESVPLVLCVCTDSVSEVVLGVGMVTMAAVVTVSVLWGELLSLLFTAPPSSALSEEREVRLRGGKGRTWMSFSSSRSDSCPAFDDRPCHHTQNTCQSGKLFRTQSTRQSGKLFHTQALSSRAKH